MRFICYIFPGFALPDQVTHSVSAIVALTLAHTVTNMAGTPEEQSTLLSV